MRHNATPSPEKRRSRKKGPSSAPSGQSVTTEHAASKLNTGDSKNFCRSLAQRLRTSTSSKDSPKALVASAMLIAVGIFSSGSVNSAPILDLAPVVDDTEAAPITANALNHPIRTHDDRSRSYGYSRNNLSNGREVEQSEIVRIVREVLAQASRTEHEILTPRTSSTRETVTAQVAQSTCLERAAQYVNQLTDSVGAKRIEVEGDPTIAPRGVFAWNSIKIRGCVSKSVLAHEVGHYIHALSSDWSWGTMSADSMVFCIGFDSITDRCEGGWLSDGGKTSEARVAPGVEHAAHCIGYVLSGIYGSYTKCPHHHLITEAHNRIATASYVSLNIT